jgi:hypothetical protein
MERSREAGRVDFPVAPPYSDTVKNITVSVDDATYHRARVRAAELRTSVSAMVRKMLNEAAGQETDQERLRRQELEIRARLVSRAEPFRASDRLSRDALHDRDALR